MILTDRSGITKSFRCGICSMRRRLDPHLQKMTELAKPGCSASMIRKVLAEVFRT
jgi:hypothetical protein